MESENIAQQMAKIHNICGDVHGTTSATLYNGSEIHIHPVTGTVAFLSKDDVLENPYQVQFSTEKGSSVSLLLLLFPSEWKLIVGQTIVPNEEREMEILYPECTIFWRGKYDAVLSSAKGISSTISLLMIRNLRNSRSRARQRLFFSPSLLGIKFWRYDHLMH